MPDSSRLTGIVAAVSGVMLVAGAVHCGEPDRTIAASLGVGLLYHVSDRVGLRLEARGWFTFTESSGAVFCAGGCVVAFSGSGFGQGELTAGLRFAF